MRVAVAKNPNSGAGFKWRRLRAPAIPTFHPIIFISLKSKIHESRLIIASIEMGRIEHVL